MKTMDVLLIGAVALGVMAFASRMRQGMAMGNVNRDALNVPVRASDIERGARQWATEQALKPFAFYE